jgi:hypothetical protein
VFIRLAQDCFQLTKYCEHGTEPPNYINMEELLDWPEDCQFLKEGSAPCSKVCDQYDAFHVNCMYSLQT